MFHNVRCIKKCNKCVKIESKLKILIYFHYTSDIYSCLDAYITSRHDICLDLIRKSRTLAHHEFISRYSSECNWRTFTDLHNPVTCKFCIRVHMKIFLVFNTQKILATKLFLMTAKRLHGAQYPLFYTTYPFRL